MCNSNQQAEGGLINYERLPALSRLYCVYCSIKSFNGCSLHEDPLLFLLTNPVPRAPDSGIGRL